MGNRNNHRHHGRRRENDVKKEQEPVAYPECPMCKKPIRELHSAISSRETGEPCHFECVVKQIGEEEELKAEERVCYLGNGTFGIVLPRASSGPVKFSIRKKIPYEFAENKAEWRAKICERISALIH